MVRSHVSITRCVMQSQPSKQESLYKESQFNSLFSHALHAVEKCEFKTNGTLKVSTDVHVNAEHEHLVLLQLNREKLEPVTAQQSALVPKMLHVLQDDSCGHPHGLALGQERFCSLSSSTVW